jgi:hypothetical protein
MYILLDRDFGYHSLEGLLQCEFIAINVMTLFFGEPYVEGHVTI